MNNATNDVEQCIRSVALAAAWVPPGSAAPVVGMVEPIISLAPGGRAMLTMSDVTRPDGGLAPNVLVLEIRNTESGLVTRDATEDVDCDDADWETLDVPGAAGNDTERIEADVARQDAFRHGVPPWWVMPQMGVAAVCAGLVFGLALASVVLDGAAVKGVCIALVALLVGLIGGLIADAIRLEREWKSNHAAGSEPTANEEHRS